MIRRTKKNTPLGIRLIQMVLFVILIMGIVAIANMVLITGRKNRQVRENEAKIEKLSQEISRLNKEIENSDSPEFVEKVAREELGMVKPRELIFIDKSKEREEKNKIDAVNDLGGN